MIKYILLLLVTILLTYGCTDEPNNIIETPEISIVDIYNAMCYPGETIDMILDNFNPVTDTNIAIYFNGVKSTNLMIINDSLIKVKAPTDVTGWVMVWTNLNGVDSEKDSIYLKKPLAFDLDLSKVKRIVITIPNIYIIDEFINYKVFNYKFDSINLYHSFSTNYQVHITPLESFALSLYISTDGMLLSLSNGYHHSVPGPVLYSSSNSDFYYFYVNYFPETNQFPVKYTLESPLLGIVNYENTVVERDIGGFYQKKYTGSSIFSTITVELFDN